MSASVGGSRGAAGRNGKRKLARGVSKPGDRFFDTLKRDTVLLGDIQRHVLSGITTREADIERRQDYLHVSEMAKADWCPRASYLRMSGAKPKKEENLSYILSSIYEEGHEVHRKYQNWLWSMGRLRGAFRCYHCDHEWEDISPRTCPPCGSPAIDYKEVVFEDDEYLICGHADGDDAETDVLMEVKTIGKGTLRFEAPELLRKHTHRVVIDDREQEYVDLDSIWRNIGRPFPSHIRQGQLYMHFLERERIIFLYECKWNQQVREFSIRHNDRYVEPLLDTALDIKYALKRGIEPSCITGTSCSNCEIYDHGASHDAEAPRRVVSKARTPTRRIRSSSHA